MYNSVTYCQVVAMPSIVITIDGIGGSGVLSTTWIRRVKHFSSHLSTGIYYIFKLTSTQASSALLSSTIIHTTNFYRIYSCQLSYGDVRSTAKEM